MKIQILTGDDWVCLYIDGKLVLENHKLDFEEVLEKVAPEIETTNIWVDDYLMENGRGPLDYPFEDDYLGEEY